MKASSDRLKECYVSPSSKRDDVTETMWLYDEGMQDDGKALQVVFSNTLWAVMVSEHILPFCGALLICGDRRHTLTAWNMGI